MNEQAAIAKAGSLLSIEEGEYSDYGVVGFFVVLTDFDPKAVLEEYLADNLDQGRRYGFRREQFIAFVISKGLLLEIKYGGWYMGSYSSCDDMRYTP